MPKTSEDDQKGDEILKRMLQTPHKPHVAKKAAKKKGRTPARPKSGKE